ncbi:MAG: nuclear transport factor 2 family protein [Pseudomonadales bacterium]
MTQTNSDDFNAITRKVYEYAYGIDTRDWALYRSIFADEIHVDFSSYSGAAASSMLADDWVTNVKVLFTGLDATQHSMSNPLVDVSGAKARCRMYMQAEHFLITDQGSNDYALGGYYDDQLARTADGWKITAVTLNVLWHRGNRHIMQLATEIGAQRLAAE